MAGHGNFAAWKFGPAEFLPCGNFVARNFPRVKSRHPGLSPRVALIFISVINTASSVFIRENKMGKLFNIFDNLDLFK